jgi:cupin fold WbuC family metalloprotein
MKISVFYNNDVVTEVGVAWYEKLKRHAFEADLKRARFCLHGSPEDALHEMVIIFHRDTVVRPHRHIDKSESFHLIFGELDILLFDEQGKPTRAVRMGDINSGKTQIYRLSGPIWHSVIVRSEYAAIHEITNGPFRPSEGDFADWAPAEPAELKRFLARALAELEARTSSTPQTVLDPATS